MSCPAVLSQLRGSLDGQKASHTKAQFVIETQQWYNFVISNVTFKAVKSTDDETTNTKARRWSIRGLKGLTFPLAATIIEGEKRTKKKKLHLQATWDWGYGTADEYNWRRSRFLEGRDYISKPYNLNLPTECSNCSQEALKIILRTVCTHVAAHLWSPGERKSR